MTILLSMAVGQNQSISPRMQQAIRLLRLSTLDFELAVRRAAVSNPFLELPEDETALEGSEEVAPAAERLAEEIPDSFAFERPGSGAPNNDEAEFARIPARQGLRDHLRAQLMGSQCSPREMSVAAALIEVMDDDGYLRDSLEQCLLAIDQEGQLSLQDLEHAISLLREFDPPGLCAQSLVECLLLQLESLAPSVGGRAIAIAILQQHLEILQRRDFVTLRRRLACSERALNEAICLIRRLDPEPGSRFSTKAPDFIVPDVIVTEKEGRHVASLNPATRAGMRLNQRYVELFRSCKRSQHPAMTEQLQEARWMVRSIEQRFDTILKVASFIVERQQDYFLAGDLALKPMVLREVSDELGMHESTVSRATGNKYMATARGCIEFKHFFSRELSTDGRESCSAAAVRSLIGGLIGSESRSAPLSDVDITAELRVQGIHIARRTVTKYRRMLKIPSAEFRRMG
ncbi:MAG: RNA polymerase factor sigma-54 [Polycyclovorans sp.]|nr:RNA polymerase factor sigma-54 [Polycyclovorans sp.]